jgi:ATP-dependent protease ClpP protease subunit
MFKHAKIKTKIRANGGQGLPIGNDNLSCEQDGDDQPLSQDDMIPFGAISLDNLGAHLMFGEVNNVTAYETINFIIKSNFMFNPGTTLTLILNTPGGSVSDGFALIDVMGTSRLEISTVGLGQVASMGVLLLSAGTKGKRVLTKNTEIMAHHSLR